MVLSPEKEEVIISGTAGRLKNHYCPMRSKTYAKNESKKQCFQAV
jgi:hypothetical protein